MYEETTAAEALQQALKQEFNADSPGASEQDGHAETAVTFVPAKAVVKESASTNEDAKKERISQKEWSDMKEAAKKAEITNAQLQKLKEALQDAPPEVQQEEDPVAQVKALKEMMERTKWEAKHPIVESEKYAASWKQVNEDPETRHLSYDRKWKLIKDEPESRIKEEWNAQKYDVTPPPASRGSARATSSNALAADLLRQSGMSDEDMVKYGLKL